MKLAVIATAWIRMRWLIMSHLNEPPHLDLHCLSSSLLIQKYEITCIKHCLKFCNEYNIKSVFFFFFFFNVDTEAITLFFKFISLAPRL